MQLLRQIIIVMVRVAPSTGSALCYPYLLYGHVCVSQQQLCLCRRVFLRQLTVTAGVESRVLPVMQINLRHLLPGLHIVCLKPAIDNTQVIQLPTTRVGQLILDTPNHLMPTVLTQR